MLLVVRITVSIIIVSSFVEIFHIVCTNVTIMVEFLVGIGMEESWFVGAVPVVGRVNHTMTIVGIILNVLAGF